jgi:hypothetical protein
LNKTYIKIIFSIFLYIVYILFFTGCISSIPTPNERKDVALSLIKSEKGFFQKNINTSTFDLFTLEKSSNSCKNLTINVYIEGDGLSWISRNQISLNPTPINPVSLKLMLSDPSNCKIYMARPCQYLNSNLCEEKYWTSHRFNDKVIQSYNEALDIIKKEYKNSSFLLVGYSGGAAVALLTASKRDDISSITTIAGNLDTDAWTKMHNISSLNGSLNPSNFSKKLENIKQHHLIGTDDDIVPKEVFLSYIDKFENKKNISYSMHEATHNCCWEEIYKNYLKGQN